MQVYLDHAATTRVCPEAAAAAFHVMTEEYGNPSSAHGMGLAARTRLENARAQVADALGCRTGELVFTSGGTESDNWALRAGAAAGGRSRRHIVTTAIEHPAVLETAKAMEREGWAVTYVAPGRDGTVKAEDMAAALRPDTALVSMMLVNNETGVVLPVRETADAILQTGAPILLHVDAVQGFLKVPFSPRSLGAQLVTVSAHKIGGAKGVGALYIAEGVRVKPFLHGGAQDRRPGTEPMPAIAAFGAACAHGRERFEEAAAHMAALRGELLSLLAARLPEVRRVGEGSAPHILCLSLPGYPGETVVRVLGDKGVCVSAGSACHKGKPSHVLAAMDVPKPVRAGAFRVSFSPESTRADLLALTDALSAVKRELLPALS